MLVQQSRYSVCRSSSIGLDIQAGDSRHKMEHRCDHIESSSRL